MGGVRRSPFKEEAVGQRAYDRCSFQDRSKTGRKTKRLKASDHNEAGEGVRGQHIEDVPVP